VSTKRYKLNANPGGLAVLHAEHPWEVCNVDDVQGVTFVDDLTAASLLEKGQARRCEHCLAEGGAEPQTLTTRGPDDRD